MFVNVQVTFRHSTFQNLALKSWRMYFVGVQAHPSFAGPQPCELAEALGLGGIKLMGYSMRAFVPSSKRAGIGTLRKWLIRAQRQPGALTALFRRFTVPE